MSEKVFVLVSEEGDVYGVFKDKENLEWEILRAAMDGYDRDPELPSPEFASFCLIPNYYSENSYGVYVAGMGKHPEPFLWDVVYLEESTLY